MKTRFNRFSRPLRRAFLTCAYSRANRKRNELAITDTELKLIEQKPQ